MDGVRVSVGPPLSLEGHLLGGGPAGCRVIPTTTPRCSAMTDVAVASTTRPCPQAPLARRTGAMVGTGSVVRKSTIIVLQSNGFS